MLVASAAGGNRPGGGSHRHHHRRISDLQRELRASTVHDAGSDKSSTSSSEEDLTAAASHPDRPAGIMGTSSSSRPPQRLAKANKMGPAYRLGELAPRARSWTPSEWLETPITGRKQEKEKKLMQPLLPDLCLRDLDQQARMHTCPHCGCSSHCRLDQAVESGSVPMSRQNSKGYARKRRTEADDEQIEVGSLGSESSQQSSGKPGRRGAAKAQGEPLLGYSAVMSQSSKKKTRALCVCASVWMIFGMLFFWSEGYGPVDSMYSLAQIITTVGYGDIVPKTNYQKIITAIIVLSSTLLMAGVVSHMIDVILDAQADAVVESLRSKEEEIKSSKQTPRSQHKSANHRKKLAAASRLGKLKLQAVIHAGVFVSFIVAGTLFFGFFESCGCPEDNLGCHPDPNKCEESGGIERDFVDTFYMAVVTITTVGYGDVVPQTLIGRLVSALYMLFGVGSTLNLVGTVTDLLKEAFEVGERLKVTKESFMAMDMNGDGNLDRHEFLRLQLTMLGLAQEEELNSIDLQFDLIDSSGDGFISREEFHSFYL